MKKVILTLSIASALFSCSTEDQATTAIFTGEYLNSETYINGELSDTCDTTWSFTDTSVFVKRVESCDKDAQGRTSGYTYDDTTLYIGEATDTGIMLVEYPYTEAVNGDLTLTLSTGDFELTYKLTR